MSRCVGKPPPAPAKCASGCEYLQIGGVNYNGVCVVKGLSLSVGATIGSGTYAKVKAVYSHSWRRLMALKVIKKSLDLDDYLRKFLPREIELLRVLSHRRVLAAHHIVETKDQVFILMDLAENGDLRDYIYKRIYISEEEARYLFSQIIEGVQYLHSGNVAHRDLKLENILLDKNMNVKIADFGFAIDVLYSPATTDCGSRAFVAPEVLLRNRSTECYDALKADVWSMGVILFAMVTGQLVFGSDTAVLTWARGGTLPPVVFPKCLHLTNPVQDLVRAMLRPDVGTRLTSDQVAQHSWGTGGPAKKPAQPSKCSVKYTMDKVGLELRISCITINRSSTFDPELLLVLIKALIVYIFCVTLYDVSLDVFFIEL